MKDDAQTRFYKRHMKRTETPTATGRTPIFNFDEWNNEHYGKAFQRSQAARKKFYGQSAENLREESSIKYEILIFGCMALLTIVFYGAAMMEKSPDDVSNSKEVR